MARSSEAAGHWYTDERGLRLRLPRRGPERWAEHAARIQERNARRRARRPLTEWREQKALRLAALRAGGPLGARAAAGTKQLRRDYSWGVS